ncbi:NADase-type glycan-binding domain-containing protein [Vallitalea guaymasensis]|uniref:NADase-type glycan-binding domain-containing protein n=1 Tax=Vallitalea guaymasensis TaxID=1185412 RepID=UPI002356587E|nr:hypothetical protein [Vallitalea guaymasensis]
MTNLLKKYIITIFIGLIIFKLQAFANGGPIEWNGVAQGGNIHFIDVDDIQLNSEFLEVYINESYIDVKVTYKLLNKGSSQNVIYAFPIKLKTQGYDTYDEIYLKNIKMFDGSKELEYQLKQEALESDRLYDLQCINNYIAKLSFEENEEKTLIISYSIKPEYVTELFAEEGSFDISLSNESFNYDFTPASNWGNGKVKEFKLLVDYRNIVNQCEGITMNIPEFSFDKSKGYFEYVKKNIDFNIVKKLSIEYNRQNFIKDKKYVLNNDAIAEVIVSSVLKDEGKYTYKPSNLFDKDTNTAWVEGKKGIGIGENIEILLEPETELLEIGIKNGYIANKDIYLKNGIIKKIKVELYGMDDSNNEYQIITKEKLLNRNVEDFGQVDYVDIYQGNGESYSNISKIKLTILEAEKGSTYEDICISDIILYGYNNPQNAYVEGFISTVKQNEDTILNQDKKSDKNNGKEQITIQNDKTKIHATVNASNKEKNDEIDSHNTKLTKIIIIIVLGIAVIGAVLVFLKKKLKS